MVGGWVFLGGREELEVEELVEDDREMARASGGGSDDFVVVFPSLLILLAHLIKTNKLSSILCT